MYDNAACGDDDDDGTASDFAIKAGLEQSEALASCDDRASGLTCIGPTFPHTLVDATIDLVSNAMLFVKNGYQDIAD